MSKLTAKNKRIIRRTYLIIGLIILTVTFLYVKSNKSSDTDPMVTSTKSLNSEDNILEKDDNATKENIEVKNNSLEYDLKVSLIKKGLNYISMQYEFYIDGSLISKKISLDKLPELLALPANKAGVGSATVGTMPEGTSTNGGITNSATTSSASSNGAISNSTSSNSVITNTTTTNSATTLDSPTTNTISQNNNKPIAYVHLNYTYAKAYFIIRTQDVAKEGLTNSLYSINFKDFEVTKLMVFEGKTSEPFLGKLMKYMIIESSNEDKKDVSLLTIFNCDNNVLVIDKNMDTKNVVIGNKTDLGKIFGYSFINWHLGEVIKLKESVYVSDNNASQLLQPTQNEVLYDIEKNIFVNIDGTVANEKVISSNSLNKEVKPQSQEQKPTSTPKVDSLPVQMLKNLEGHLSSQNFSAAYKLFGDEFLLNAFGLKSSAPIKKSDISEETFRVAYGDTLKGTKIKKIVAENVEKDTATVYFYMIYTSKKGDVVEYPISIRMRSTKNGWKVYELRDEDPLKAPFKK